MDSKFLGIGLTKALAIALFTMVVIVLAKVAINKYPVEGASQLINSI